MVKIVGYINSRYCLAKNSNCDKVAIFETEEQMSHRFIVMSMRADSNRI